MFAHSIGMGRTALVTGSTRGLGRTMADWLAREGANIIVSGRGQDAVDAAVIGTPDPRWGNVVTAFLEVREPTASEEIDQHCRTSSLDDFKRPRRIVFLDAIPRNPSGKIIRSELRGLYEQGLAGNTLAESATA